MPFKLKLKKSRQQYNVMSKDLFVISVVCLDGSNIDCTLSSESKGLECLENVCQRAGLNQNEFFGLRYFPKGSNDERWVDLDRPLNRQLEKYAANTKVLYLRIMYYVISGVSLITDEATRNYYFLQLKQDIVEGRISCDPKQAVILANYSRQAEYGNMNQDRHKSVDYLKSLLSFPKHLIDNGMLEALTEEVIQHHDEVHDVTQAAAEELYISLCQQLDGYGQETYMARNDESMEVMLGISVSGVIVGTSGTHKFYPWREIVNVVNHKRTFNIECTDHSQNVGFTLQDAETGRYIWKLCVSQHTFFMNYEQNQSSQVNMTNLFQNIPDNFNDSREDLLSSDDKLFYSSNSHIAIPSSNTNLSVANRSKWITSSELLLNTNQMDSRASLQTSTIDINLPMNAMMGSSIWNPVGSNASLVNRAQSSSCLDLTNSNANINLNNNNANNQNNKEHLKSLLPTYRPAPSYETAIMQKYRGSQPDVNVGVQAMYENYGHPQVQHFPDVTHHTSSNMIGPNYSDASDYGLSQRFKMMSIKPPPQYPISNRLSSTSTPDLALASHRGLFGYRASGSSPDLVSSRTLLNHQGFIPSNARSILYPYTIATAGGMKQRLRHSHSFLPHATYENLNFIEPTNPNMFPSKHIPNNLIIRTSSSVAAHQQLADMEYYLQKQQQHHSFTALNLSNSHISEPIYENVPLPSYEQPSDNVQQRVSIEMRSKPVQTQQLKPIQMEPPIDTGLMNKFNNNSSNKNVNETISGNENAKYMQHYLIANSDNNGNTMSTKAIMSTSSKSNIAQEKDFNLNNIPAATSTSSLYQNHQQQMKQRQHANVMNLSGSSSNCTINTTTVADTTDSGISTGMGKKERKNKLWNILSGGSKSKSSSKQKSATLGREKDKHKKDKANQLSKEAESNLKHRWSTGLPRLQPLPANISKEKLCQLLETKLNDSELFLEFERIPKRKDNAQYSCALMEENRNKNSDRTSLPMDENRVKLTPSRENRMGYVNASHITSTVGQKQRFYIAAQSAHDTLTANVFWQCVWEADVYLLVQLSDEFIYVPPNSERCLEYGQYQVWREFSQETNRITTSKLRIYHTQSRRYRSVWHLSWYEWNEQHCPKDLSQFLKFLEELSSVRLASVSEVPPGHNSNPPVLIHCNEGERTGLTLVADLLLYTMDHNQDLDVPRVIGSLREQRDKIIPSLVQYKSIYALLIHYLRQTRLI